MSGDPAEGFRSWQRAAGSFTPCPGATGYDGYNGSLTEEVSSTLGVNCGMSTGRNGILLNDQGGNRMEVSEDVAATTAYVICSKDSNAMKSDNPHSGIYKADVARTLDLNGGSPACNQGGVMVVYVDKEDR